MTTVGVGLSFLSLRIRRAGCISRRPQHLSRRDLALKNLPKPKFLPKTFVSVLPSHTHSFPLPKMVLDTPDLEMNGFDEILVEGVEFAATEVAPGSTQSLVLGGAGVRGITIDGSFKRISALGIYVDEAIVHHLSPKLGGKSVDELCRDELLFEEILSAPHEKFVRVVFFVSLPGTQFAAKVLECIRLQPYVRNLREETKQKFLDAFQPEDLLPGSAVLYSFSKQGLKLALSSDGSVPAEPKAVFQDEAFATAVLATVLWRDGVSPALKTSLANRLSKHLIPPC